MILEANDLSLIFHPTLYRPWTWKDALVRLIGKSPANSQSERYSVVAAKNLSFNIQRGERVGIIGPNGAGKTSLCRCIAGIYHPTSGKIRTEGKVRAVFDTALGMQPDLTGRENACLLSRLIYPEVIDHDSLVEEALAFSGLGSLVDMPFHLYSNGMQARLSLSLVSGKPCDLLILDEVFDGADAEFRERVSKRILSTIEKSGAVIFVSHGMEQIRKVCNRVIVLVGGQILHDGGVNEGIERYNEFLGVHGHRSSQKEIF